MRIVVIALLALLFVGCTGRVQTNPSPTEKEIKVPTNYTPKEPVKIDEEILSDFDLFVRKVIYSNDFHEDLQQAIEEARQ